MLPPQGRKPAEVTRLKADETFSLFQHQGGSSTCAGAPHYEEVFLLPSAASRFAKQPAAFTKSSQEALARDKVPLLRGHERIGKEPGTHRILCQRYSDSLFDQQKAIKAADRARAAADQADAEEQREMSGPLARRKQQRLSLLRARLIGE